jgi:uncharacterized membrane protein
MCEMEFSRRDAMLRHKRNKHGTNHPYPQLLLHYSASIAAAAVHIPLSSVVVVVAVVVSVVVVLVVLSVVSVVVVVVGVAAAGGTDDLFQGDSYTILNT